MSRHRRLRFDGIMRMFDRYRREVVRCRDASAYFAACAVLGAAIESLLLMTVRMFPYQVYYRGHLSLPVATSATGQYDWLHGRKKTTLTG